MAKYNLVTKIRSANPYRKMAKSTYEQRSYPNLLNREFNQEEPEKVLLTDITYLNFGKGQKYTYPAYKMELHKKLSLITYPLR
ncbi:hypothetical protein [Cytobacillus firmus]|uniref:hypothetical protein n=1 Tax=Cytobacillus firmus TaxID=1399 RepID=UPI0018CD2A0F|nr:hypothetical protein [Cytobacillus firmus]